MKTAAKPFAVPQRTNTEIELQYTKAQVAALEQRLRQQDLVLQEQRTALSDLRGDDLPLLEGSEVVEILPNKFESAAAEIGALVAARNKTYGNSFAKTGQFLQLLYGESIPADRFNDALLLVRMFDKQMRIATGHTTDSYRDIAGYALLGETQTESE